MIIGAAMQSKRIRSFSEEGLAIVDGICAGNNGFTGPPIETSDMRTCNSSERRTRGAFEA
jgi:hypothetical protein